jgi:hypothetical protein
MIGVVVVVVVEEWLVWNSIVASCYFQITTQPNRSINGNHKYSNK